MVEGSTRTRLTCCCCTACSSRPRTSSPASALTQPRTFSGYSMPSSQASLLEALDMPNGATPTSQMARSTRSGEERCAGQYMWPTSRPSADAQAIEAELVRERARTPRATSSTTRRPWFRSGPPVSRTIVGHVAHAQLGVHPLACPPHQDDSRACRATRGSGTPPGPPETANASVRPSGVSNDRRRLAHQSSIARGLA